MPSLPELDDNFTNLSVETAGAAWNSLQVFDNVVVEINLKTFDKSQNHAGIHVSKLNKRQQLV